MREINIVIINGKPRSGKDTVIKFMKQFCNLDECARCYAYSTIDPVKSALVSLGWNGEKDSESRNMLATLKQFWISNCDGPLKYCIDTIMSRISGSADDLVLVFQIREPDEITKLVNALDPIKSAYGFNVSTLFVNRFPLEEEHYGNAADMNVADYEYDAEIVNNGTIEDLKKVVFEYMNELLEVK